MGINRINKTSSVKTKGFFTSTSPALSFDELQGLSYLQVKGSGLSNTCPVIENTTASPSTLPSGNYQFSSFCMEPTALKVKESASSTSSAPFYQDTKLMTRLTYTLADMIGTLKLASDGSVQFNEVDGIDYAPTTVQLPGGERVPFLFSAKQLTASGTLDKFSGTFLVPSYRGATFLDPKGRGGATGYDTAVALPARGDDDELSKENNKSVSSLTGTIVLSALQFDSSTLEISGFPVNTAFRH